MVDQIDQAINIIVPWIDRINDDENDKEDDEDKKIIDISGYNTNIRPLYLIKRRKYIKVIRQQLQMKNRILLKAFNTYAYYSCTITEMQQKILEHMTNTGAYSLITELNRTNQDDVEKYLNIMDQRITLTLNNLLHDRSITASQRVKMEVNRSSRKRQRLDSLYFLPNIRRENVPFHPMINYHSGSTSKISHFLSDLLQPIYDRITYLKTFNTSIDLIDTLEEYVKKDLLRLNTRFVTLHIHDLSTIISHEQIIETLQRFLHEYMIDGRIAGIPIQNMIDLVRLFLENQYIFYDNKIYQQIRGSAFNSPLTTILVNIYLYYWQQDLVTILNNKNEIFGRCFTDIFFTWNESDDKLYDLFQTMNKQYSDMKMAIEINDNINYLDLNISHIDGDLKIQVAHDLNIEPYLLPYLFDHQQYHYSTLPRTAFIRAVRCYTNVYDFANELEDLQLSFQYNGFERDFFHDKFQLFLKEFDATNLKLQNGEAYYDQSLYDYLRQIVFNYNQQQKKAKIKRLQRQTIQYRWAHPLNSDFPFNIIDVHEKH